jgi:hypothetical protein
LIRQGKQHNLQCSKGIKELDASEKQKEKNEELTNEVTNRKSSFIVQTCRQIYLTVMSCQQNPIPESSILIQAPTVQTSISGLKHAICN